MYTNKTNANGNISKIVKKLNNNIKNLNYIKIRVLEPSENEKIYLKDLREYEALKVEIKDLLSELMFINKEIFMGTLNEYVTLKLNEYNRIINLK